jgi:hypothetical protein
VLQLPAIREHGKSKWGGLEQLRQLGDFGGPFGLAFVEVVSPVEADTAAGRSGSRTEIRRTGATSGQLEHVTGKYVRRLNASSFGHNPPTQRGFNSPQRISKIVQFHQQC